MKFRSFSKKQTKSFINDEDLQNDFNRCYFNHFLGEEKDGKREVWDKEGWEKGMMREERWEKGEDRDERREGQEKERTGEREG